MIEGPNTKIYVNIKSNNHCSMDQLSKLMEFLCVIPTINDRRTKYQTYT